MADVTVSTITHFLKGQFKKGAVQEEVVEASASPLYQLINKNTNFGGEYKKIPLIYGLLPSGSATFSVALANKGGIKGVAFKLLASDLKHDYSVFGIDGMTLRVAKTNEQAFFEQLDKLVRAGYRTQARRRAWQLYRSTTGAIGQVHATGAVNATTMTFMHRGTARLVDKDAELVFSAADGGALDTAGASLVVNNMNRMANPATAIMSAVVNTVTATSHYIYFKGDWNQCLHGILDWIPVTDPAPSSSYYGVDRSVDRQKLAGIAMDCSTLDPLSALIEACSLAIECGAEKLAAFEPPETFRKIKELIRGSTTYTATPVSRPAILADGNKSQMVSVRGFAIDGDKGPIEVYSDVWCPPTFGFVLDLDRFTLESAGEDPGVLSEDGLKMLREASADGYEGRVGGYIEMTCDGPGNCVTLYNHT